MRHVNDDEGQRRCVCLHCGETFIYGYEGDNEKYHLRCERESWLQERQAKGDDWDYDDYHGED